MNIKLNQLVVMSVMALAATSAHASSISSITLDSFTVTLTDLNPSDGISPYILWGLNPSNPGILSDNSLSAAGYVYNQYQNVNGQHPFANVSSSANGSPINGATSSLTSGPDPTKPDGMVLSASGYANYTPYSSANFPYISYADVAYASFVLSPFTSATFSGHLVEDVTTTTATNPLNYGEYAETIAQLGVTGPNNSTLVTNEIDLVANTGVPQHLTIDTIISAMFTNASDTQVDGDFHAYTEAIGDAPAPPPVGQGVPAVPEPATNAMLLSGLGLIGFMVRRRSKGNNHPMMGPMMAI